MNSKLWAAVLALPLAAIASTATATAASASSGSGVITTGNCSGATDWKMKAKPDNGRIEVEFEVEFEVDSQPGRR